MAALSGSGAIGSLPIGSAAIGSGVSAPITGSLVVTETGSDSAAASGKVLVKGSLAVTETGQDTLAGSGGVRVSGSFSATETGTDTAAGSGKVIVKGTLAVTESGADTAAFSGKVIVAGSLSGTEQGQDVFSGSGGSSTVTGTLAATETGEDVFSADSSRKAGGYDYKSRKRYYVRVGDRILGFATAREATAALPKDKPAEAQADTVESTDAPDEVLADADQAPVEPQPVEVLPLAELLAYADVLAEREKVRAMLRRNEYEALARVYETWRDEEDVELLLVSL